MGQFTNLFEKKFDPTCGIVAPTICIGTPVIVDFDFEKEDDIFVAHLIKENSAKEAKKDEDDYVDILPEQLAKKKK